MKLKSEELQAEKSLNTVGQFKIRETRNKSGQTLLIANIENKLLKYTKLNGKEYCTAIALKNNTALNIIDVGTKNNCSDERIHKLMKDNEKYIHLHTHTNHSPHSVKRTLKDLSTTQHYFKYKIV